MDPWFTFIHHLRYRHLFIFVLFSNMRNINIKKSDWLSSSVVWPGGGAELDHLPRCAGDFSSVCQDCVSNQIRLGERLVAQTARGERVWTEQCGERRSHWRRDEEVGSQGSCQETSRSQTKPETQIRLKRVYIPDDKTLSVLLADPAEDITKKLEKRNNEATISDARARYLERKQQRKQNKAPWSNILGFFVNICHTFLQLLCQK